MSTVTAATVEAVLRVRDNNFTVSMKGAEEATKRTEQATKRLQDRLQSVSEVGGRLGGALTAGLTAPLLAIGAAAVKTTVQMDSLRRGLTAVTGSSAEAERQLVRLKKIAELPGLGFQEAVQGSIRLQAAGYSAKQAESALREFGNAIAVVGGGKEQLDGVTLALSQIASKGKVSAEEINQLAERMPQVRKAMEAAFGTSNTEILQQANITANEFLDAMTTVLARDQRVGDTLKNQFENAQQKITDSLDRIGRAVTPKVAAALDSVASGIERVTRAFDRLPNYGQDLIVRLGITALIAGPVISGLARVAELLLTIRNLSAGGALAGAAQGAAGAAGGMAARGAMAGRLGLYGIAAWGAFEGLNAIGQESINQSERSIANNSLANPERVKFLQSEIARKRRIAGQFKPGSSVARSHQADIDRMQSEINVLSRVEAGQAARQALDPFNAKKQIQEILNRPAPVIDATARANANKTDKSAAARAKREAERIAEANKRVREEIERIQAATKSEFAAARVGNQQEFDQLIEEGVRPDLAIKLLNLKNLGVDREEKQSKGEAALRGISRGTAGGIASLMSSLGSTVKGLQDRQTRREALAAGLEALDRRSQSKGLPEAAESPLAMARRMASSGSIFTMRDAPTVTGDPTYDPVRAIQMRRARMLAGDVAQFGGQLGRGAFADLVSGRNVIGNALERIKGAGLNAIGDELGHAIEKGLRKRLTSVFEEAVSKGVGEKLKTALDGSLAGIRASAGAILSAAYGLIATLNRRKSFGLGSLAGGVLGFLSGGPLGAIQGYNIGNAIDNNDWGGAIMGGATAWAGGAFDRAGGTAATDAAGATGPMDGRSVKGRSSRSITINHFGNMYGIEDMEQASARQGRAISRALAFG